MCYRPSLRSLWPGGPHCCPASALWRSAATWPGLLLSLCKCGWLLGNLSCCPSPGVPCLKWPWCAAAKREQAPELQERVAGVSCACCCPDAAMNCPGRVLAGMKAACALNVLCRSQAPVQTYLPDCNTMLLINSHHHVIEQLRRQARMLTCCPAGASKTSYLCAGCRCSRESIWPPARRWQSCSSILL